MSEKVKIKLKRIRKWNCPDVREIALYQKLILWKMNKFLTFSEIEIKKHKFHYSKYPVGIDNIDIDKTMIYNKVFLGKTDFKYFIGYTDIEIIRPLTIILSNMNICQIKTIV